MPSLNFKGQFVDKIIQGAKTQTIRKYRRFPIKKGDKLYLFTGLRTKWVKKLGEANCSDVFDIKILPDCSVMIKMENDEDFKLIDANEAWVSADGFTSVEQFYKFWRLTDTLPFSGQLIFWENFVADQNFSKTQLKKS